MCACAHVRAIMLSLPGGGACSAFKTKRDRSRSSNPMLLAKITVNNRIPVSPKIIRGLSADNRWIACTEL
jgi:hypothetical protein